MVATTHAKSKKSKTAEARLPDPPPGWMTRNEAAELLFVSHNTIVEWQRKGLIASTIARSRTGNHETHYYNPDELRRVPRRANRFIGPNSPGEIAARVFELLRDGLSVAEVVIEARVEPAIVEDLRQQWLESNEHALLVPERERDEIERLLGNEVEVRTAAELVKLIRDHVASTAGIAKLVSERVA
jgi:hypothetical protein